MSDQPLPQQDEDAERWVEDQLRARGLNPQDLTLEQMLSLMEESVQLIIARLQDATQAAGELSAADELTALIEQAKELDEDLKKLHTEMGDQ